MVFLLEHDAAFDVNKGNLNFSLSAPEQDNLLEQSRVIAVNHKNLHEQAILQMQRVMLPKTTGFGMWR